MFGMSRSPLLRGEQRGERRARRPATVEIQSRGPIYLGYRPISLGAYVKAQVLPRDGFWYFGESNRTKVQKLMLRSHLDIDRVKYGRIV